jgi:epoxyqueuosine reductase
MINPAVFQSKLASWKTQSGCLEAAVLPLSPELLEKLSNLPDLQPEAAEYLHKNWDLRRHPLKAFPFTKTIICAAFPFNDLPEVNLPKTENPAFSGTIAGYASRLDYHIAGHKKMSALEEAFNFNESRICIDTFPLAEKPVAEFAGLGIRGRNSCILCKGAFSGCYLAFILTDETLSSMRPAPMEFDCDACKRCEEACPNNALQDKKLSLSRCISFLTMEKRGELTNDEAVLLQDSLFGCSCCTVSCPGNSMPEDVQLNLEWLLLESTANVRRTIHNTPLEYAGITQLRRNAIYILNNRNTSETLNLLQRFQKETGSDFLRKITAGILN